MAPPKLMKSGSFRHSFAEKKEKLLSMRSEGYTQIGIFEVEEQGRMVKWWKRVQRVAHKALEMGRSDPRKIVFTAKMGLALTLISLLIFLKEPFKDMGRHSVWAILTVVVVFEFSIGIN